MEHREENEISFEVAQLNVDMNNKRKDNSHISKVKKEINMS